MAKLVIERGKKWNIEDLSPKTIALDGAIEGPCIDAENEIFSFDHHGNCIRGLTLATCEQVRDFLMLGLDVSGYTVLLNDIDLDSALSAWLIEYPDSLGERLVDRLIHFTGRQDAHAGAYPVPKDIQDVMDWIAAPEIKMRKDSIYQSAGPDFLQIVLESIWRRIEQYVTGKLPADLSEKTKEETEETEEYEILKKGTGGWRLVKTNSERALRGLHRDNINRFVVIRELSQDSDGNNIKSMSVTVGKRSEVITGFPIGPADKKGTILYALNQEEPDRKDKTDEWGGGTTIGGSPRNENGIGTKLSIEKIFSTIEDVVTGKTKTKTKKKAKAKKKT